MKFVDDVRWSDQHLELQQDETSRKFLDFFLAWFDLAEEISERVDDSGDTTCGGIVAVRKALAVTEEVHGYLAMEWLGQMLLLAQQHWVYGERMEQGMSVIERRLLEQMAAIKLVELQDAATL